MASSSPPDYAKQITLAKELESKLLRIGSNWTQHHGWMQEEKLKTMEESKDARQELRAAVKKEGEPSFAQPLVRALYKTGDEDAPNKDSSQTLNVCCCQPNDGMGADFANGSQPLENEPNNGNIERNDRSKMPRPPFAQTTNAEYGRFGFEPLEEGGSTIRRIAYSKQHKIGRLNAKH